MQIPNTNHNFVVEESASAGTTVGDDFIFAFADERWVLRMATPAIFNERTSKAPNLSLKSDPACIAFGSLSTSRYPGSARRLGAGVAA